MGSPVHTAAHDDNIGKVMKSMVRHDDGKMTMREKLEQHKEIDRRNEYRSKAFAEMKVEQEEKYMRLVDLYVHGEISKEAFFRYLRNIRANDKESQV